MTARQPPFESLRHLPHDLATGMWLVIIVAGFETIRPWLARTLTHWGARLT